MLHDILYVNNKLKTDYSVHYIINMELYNDVILRNVRIQLFKKNNKKYLKYNYSFLNF